MCQKAAANLRQRLNKLDIRATMLLRLRKACCISIALYCPCKTLSGVRDVC